MLCKQRKCASFALLAIGNILTIVGLILGLLCHIYITMNITLGSTFQTLVLTNHSQSDGLWNKTSSPLYFSIYLYNWTNSKDVVNSTWKILPKFKECGPYVFLKHQKNINMTWNTNDTVTYQELGIWNFLPESSNGTLDDIITNVNPIVAIAGVRIKNLPDVSKKIIVNPTLTKFYKKGLIVSKSVRELLFVGFEDPILDILKKLNLPGLNIPFDRFGWFYGQNGLSTDGTYTINTGNTDLKRLGTLQLWNHNNKTQALEGACNDVNKTSEELLGPQVKQDDKGFAYSSNICSKIGLHFHNSTRSQACFSLSKCMFDAPGFIFEPNIGIPVDAKDQLQVNYYVEPVSYVSLFEHIKPTFMPMVWFRTRTSAPKPNPLVVNVLLSLSGLGTYIGWSLFGIGIILNLLGISTLFIRKSENYTEQLLD